MRKMTPQKALIQKKGCCGSAAVISLAAESADVESVAATCVHAVSATTKNATEQFRRGMTPGNVGKKYFRKVPPESTAGIICREMLPECPVGTRDRTVCWKWVRKCAESVLAGSEKCAERNVRKRAIRVNEECLREAHPLKIRVAQRGEKV